MRDREIARLGEVPFARYYGSVDATPLFILVTGEYFRRTSDIETARALWPRVQAALHWIDTY
jgi:glycogen debranching enzyme